jgi:RNA polymerase sigma-70 factor, ECF subfamily
VGAKRDTAERKRRLAAARLLFVPATRAPQVSGGSIVAFERERSDEAELVRAVERGDHAAVAELFDVHAPSVRKMLTRMLGSRSDVDDLVQETFVVVVRRIHTLERAGALRSFVVSVGVRIARNELRKRRLRSWVGLSEMPDPPIVAEHDPVTAERVRKLYAALDRLDARSRTLFMLRHVEGMELAELAELERCSLSTIKRRLARAEKRFDAVSSRCAVLSELYEEQE